MPDVADSINAINAIDSSIYRDTPLLKLIRGGNGTVTAIRALLDHGADPRPQFKGQNTPLYVLADSYRHMETFVEEAQLLIGLGVDLLAETSSGACVQNYLLRSVNWLSRPPRGDRKVHNDSIELKCHKFITAVRMLLPQEGGAAMVSKILPQTVRVALVMFLRPPRSLWYDEKYYYEVYVKALPVIAATFKELISLFLKQGADPSEPATLDYRFIEETQTAAEALIYNFWRLDGSRGSDLGEIDKKADRITRDTILETLQLILRAGRSYVSPSSMRMLLWMNLSLNLPLLQVYLDSIPLPEQRQYIDQLSLELRGNGSAGKVCKTTQSLKDALTRHMSMLLSLRYLCRHCIVSVLATSDTDTDHLPLPTALKQYIRHGDMF